MKTYSIYAVVLSVLLTACATPGSVQKAEEARSRLQIAEAMFRERCKNAGERIYKTVENVDGIVLMKLRPAEINYGDQFALDDPYGSDSRADSYIKTFFSEFYRTPSKPPSGWHPQPGYLYVEAIDPKDGKRYRYTGSIKEVTHTSSLLMGGDGRTTFKTMDFVLDRTPAAGPMPRYGVTYDDISTREEREYWIAGSSLKIIDMQANEVIAERIGYMMDRGQGNTSGGRSPWLLAAYHACPAFPVAPGGHPVQADQTRNFVMKVIKPTLRK